MAALLHLGQEQVQQRILHVRLVVVLVQPVARLVQLGQPPAHPEFGLNPAGYQWQSCTNWWDTNSDLLNGLQLENFHFVYQRKTAATRVNGRPWLLRSQSVGGAWPAETTCWVLNLTWRRACMANITLKFVGRGRARGQTNCWYLLRILEVSRGIFGI